MIEKVKRYEYRIVSLHTSANMCMYTNCFLTEKVENFPVVFVEYEKYSVVFIAFN